jgi:integrase
MSRGRASARRRSMSSLEPGSSRPTWIISKPRSVRPRTRSRPTGATWRATRFLAGGAGRVVRSRRWSRSMWPPSRPGCASGDASGRPGLAASSVARGVAAVRSLHGLPCATATPPTIRRRRSRPAPASQAAAEGALAGSGAGAAGRSRPDTPMGLRDAALLELLYGTGARVSEVLASRRRRRQRPARGPGPRATPVRQGTQGAHRSARLLRPGRRGCLAGARPPGDDRPPGAQVRRCCSTRAAPG